MSTHRLNSISKVLGGFVNLEGGMTRAFFVCVCYWVALNLCADVCFVFIQPLNKLKALRIIFVLRVRGVYLGWKRKINVSGLCNCGAFSCVAFFIMRKELKIPPRQYLKYQSHCLMPLSHCTTNSIAQCSAVSWYVKHR